MVKLIKKFIDFMRLVDEDQDEEDDEEELTGIGGFLWNLFIRETDF